MEKDLRKHFTQFGQVVDVQVMRDKEKGVSRCFGFVTFACSFMAEAAFEHKEDHLINDKVVALRLARPDKKRSKKTLPELEREQKELNDACKNKRSFLNPGFIFVPTSFVQNKECSSFLQLTPTL